MTHSRPDYWRFMRKVRRGDEDECWLWIGALDKDGTGVTRQGSRVVRAHRVAWQLEYGPIPAGVSIRRSCGNTRCVSPAHLFQEGPGAKPRTDAPQRQRTLPRPSKKRARARLDQGSSPADPLAAERQGAIDYLHELEILYTCMRDRIGTRMEAEARAGAPDWTLKKDFDVAVRLLCAHVRLFIDLGVGPPSERSSDEAS